MPADLKVADLPQGRLAYRAAGPELAMQLSEAFPNSTLTTVPAGRTFLPLDHPNELAQETTAASGTDAA